MLLFCPLLSLLLLLVYGLRSANFLFSLRCCAFPAGMESLFETVSQNELFFFKMLLVMAFHHSNRAVQNPPFNPDKSLHALEYHSKLGKVTHICNLSMMKVESGELRVQVNLGPMKCYLQGKGLYHFTPP